MELFSRRFFKENFFEFLLELGSDPVLNVRLKFCIVPPRLKSLLKLPSDRHLLQQLEQCIRNLLSNEKEPDVCNAVREAFMKLDKTKYEDDKLDQQKEEEERLLIVMEEKEREELAGASKVSDPRRKGSKDDKRKVVAAKGKASKPESHSSLKRTPSNSGSTSTGVAKASQKTVPQRNSGLKGSPSSSLQRLPSLSSALPSTASPSTSSTSAGAWKGSLNASGNPAARSTSSTSGVKTASKTAKEKTSDKTAAGKSRKPISVSSSNSSRGGF